MLKVKNLSKQYKQNDFYSLKNVSFELEKGEVVGLIGNNGAGKTTLMKMIAKTMIPSSGTIEINDKNIRNSSNSLKNVNFMIEASFFNHISAYENIKFYLTINKQNASKQQIKDVMSLVNLWHVKNKKASQFSFGMKQRLGLALCLASEPDIVIMDEPFVGLDPNGVSTLINKLKNWAKEKQMSILISSHQLSELEAICDRYLYLESGELKKSFNKRAQNVTIIHLANMVEEDISKKYEDTFVENNIVKTLLKDSDFSNLLSDLTKSNTIKSIEHQDYLKNVFKGEDE